MRLGRDGSIVAFSGLDWRGYIISMSFYWLPPRLIMARASFLVSFVWFFEAATVLVVAGFEYRWQEFSSVRLE